MKRSVILMGGKTHVISLPSQWVRRYGVKKGDELDLEERDNSVVITSESVSEDDICEVNVSSVRRMLGRVVGALYKAGYAKVKIIFEDKMQLQEIEQTLQKTCIGFEITDQGRNYVIVKSLSQSKPEEFANSLKRLFYTLEIMNEDLRVALEASDKIGLLAVVEKDKQVNKLADFCRRVLNGKRVEFSKKPTVVYYIVEQLEKLGDIYKRLAKDAVGKEAKSADFENLLRINELFVLFRKLYYSFSMKDLEAFGETFDEFKRTFAKSKGKFSVHHQFLLDSIFDMNGALITLRV